MEQNEYIKGELIAEGKTKWIYAVEGRPELVIVKNKNEITAFDDPKFTKRFETKAQSATTTTSRVFEMLHRAGIKTAFVEQISDTEFVMKRCQMLPLEVVGRNFAEGSFCDRNPAFTKGEHIPLAPPIIEFFLKTTKGKCIINGKTLVEGLNKKQEDPFITNPFDREWELLHSKKPASDSEADLKRTVLATEVLAPYSDLIPPPAIMKEIKEEIVKILAALTAAFDRIGIYFEDFKIEFGIDPETEEIIVADVIDNDSWRIADRDWVEYSKQRFRDGEEIENVEKLYKLVAELVSRPEFLGEVT